MFCNPFEALDKKIKNTEDELQNLNNSYNNDSLEYLLVNDELQRRLSELTSQRIEAENSFGLEKVIVKLSGHEIGKGTIPIRILSSVLDGIQSMSDSIANAIFNAPTIQGRIPNNILHQTDLILKNVFEGSFGMVLEGQAEEKFLDDDPLLTRSLGKLFNLLGSFDDSDSLLEQFSELGTRTIGHYKQWLKDLSELNVNMELEWQDCKAEKHRLFITNSKLPSIVKALESIVEETVEEIELPGLITGLNIRKETFEISLNDGTIISGKSNQELLLSHKNLVGEKANLMLLKTVIKNLSTGHTKIKWFLKTVTLNKD